MNTVYLVDDDPGVRRSLTRVLREDGFDVQAYASAEAFLDRPDANSRGCLVLDVRLPGLAFLANLHDGFVGASANIIEGKRFVPHRIAVQITRGIRRGGMPQISAIGRRERNHHLMPHFPG
jgi:hypothetical protein